MKKVAMTVVKLCLLPFLCRASPSAPCNQNPDPKRRVSITASNASTYQMYHRDTFDNHLGHSMFQNPRFAPRASPAAACSATLRRLRRGWEGPEPVTEARSSDL